MQLKSIKTKLLFGILKHFPFKEKTVLFISFGGQYGDNPKYISEELHEKYPETDIVWALSNKSSRQCIPPYIKIIDVNSVEFILYSSVAKVIVDNMNGIREKQGNQYIKWLDYFLKRKGQLNISTWHGTPLKRIGCDVAEWCISNYQTSSAFITCGNRYSYEIFSRAFHGIQIKALGTPRNDILIKKNTNIEAIKVKLKLPVNKKIILYAPTYRKSLDESGLRLIKQVDTEQLFTILKKRFGGEWVLVLRLHHEVLLAVHSECKNYIDNNYVYDGNTHDDMAEYLKSADILLTDYSSSLFDYMLTKKPCFLMAFDKENYIHEERGLYMDIENLPYTFSDSIEELFHNIENYDVAKTIEMVEDFIQKIGNYDDGHASEKMVQYIVKFLETNEG